LLKNVPNKDVYKGYVLATPNIMKTANKFKAKVYILSEKEGGRAKPFKSGYKPQFFFRVSNITGTILLEKKNDDDEDIVMPGESLVIEVLLGEKAVINNGLRFIMREGKKTIGAGAILSIIE
jgi:elongation factor Tu